jgi:hypothetical protein
MTGPAVPAGGRDERLDFYRGLALLFIFLNHIPNNAGSWITSRNFGFSDATEIFVFISGYAAALAYGAAMRRRGFLLAAARILHRAWQLYIAHVFLFVLFTAQIAYVAARFNNPMYAEEMNLIGFIDAPHENLVQALLLKFRPVNMDVLPLYIVLLLAFPPALWALGRRPAIVLAASALLYLAAGHYNWNLPGYPEGKTWFFNPLCWQFLFVLGAWCGTRRDVMARLEPYGRVLVPAAAAYLGAALFVVASWRYPALAALVPDGLARWMYPIDKTNLDLLRLVHFLAMAYLAARFTPVAAGFFRWPPARPVIACGRHSLEVFCLGVFLSFTAHFFLVEVNGSVPAQLAASALGIAAMALTAAALDWYRRAEAAPPRAADPAGAAASGRPTADGR